VGRVPAFRCEDTMSEENTTTGNKPMQEKLRILLGAVLLVVISYQLGLGHARSERRVSEYSAVKAQYDRIETQYTALKTEYDRLETQYSALMAQHGRTQTQYSSLKAQYDRIEKQKQTMPEPKR
jgi:septal ring factor EnvC (AmiA/AmiB activator)